MPHSSTEQTTDSRADVDGGGLYTHAHAHTHTHTEHLPPPSSPPPPPPILPAHSGKKQPAV